MRGEAELLGALLLVLVLALPPPFSFAVAIGALVMVPELAGRERTPRD